MRYALGVGVSSAASAHEVRLLVARVLELAELEQSQVVAVATHEDRVAHAALRGLPWTVHGYDAATLKDVSGDLSASRFPVAEPAALLAAGRDARLVVRVTRSAHATAALACAPREPQ